MVQELRCLGSSTRAKPKSQILRSQLLLTSKFLGFKSLRVVKTQEKEREKERQKQSTERDSWAVSVLAPAPVVWPFVAA
jgi:hypothetical protein